MNYADILKNAWTITWKNKRLWWFGVLLGLPGVLAAIPMVALSVLMSVQAGSPSSFLQVVNWLNAGGWMEVWAGFMGFFLLMMLVSLFFSIIGMAGPTLGALHHARGEAFTFRSLFKDSLTHFWRLLGFYALTYLGIMVIVMVLEGFMLIVSLVTIGLGFFLMAPLMMLIYPLMVAWYAWLELCTIAILRDKLGIMDAIRHGWQMLRAKFWQVFLLSLILYFGTFILSTIIVFPLMLPMFFVPMLFMMNTTPGAVPAGAEALTTSLLISGGILLVFIPLMVALIGFLIAYWQATWVLAYEQISTQPNPEPAS